MPFATAWCSPSKTRSEEHTSELQSHSEISYAVFCLKKKKRHAYIVGFAALLISIPFLGYYLFYPGDTPLSDYFFFFNDTATTEIYTLSYTLSLHDALPI